MNLTIPFIIYLVLHILYRVGSYAAMRHSKAPGGGSPGSDPSYYLISIPFFLVIAGPVLEHFLLGAAPKPVALGLGVLLFLGGTFFRIRGLVDIGRGFSMFLETDERHQLVTSGIYSKIRHPLYLGNLLLFLACPLLLGASYSWIAALAGIAGILLRIPIEEKFMKARFAEYEEYRQYSSALIPGVY